MVRQNGQATATASGVLSHLLSVDFCDTLSGWAVGYDGLILSTTDGGQTWTKQPRMVSAHLLAVSAIKPNKFWAAGWSGAILHYDGNGL